MRHPSPAARAIRNDPAPKTTAPMARATHSPAGCETFDGDGCRHDNHRAQVHDPDDEEDRQAGTAVAAVEEAEAQVPPRPSAGNVQPRPGASRQQPRRYSCIRRPLPERGRCPTHSGDPAVRTLRMSD
jgi:hypothetical protein